MRHAAQDLIFFQTFGDRDFNGPIKWEFAAIDLLQDINRLLEGIIAFEQVATKPLASDLDFFCQRDLLFTGQQGNFAHLREIHADRIINFPGFVFGLFRFNGPCLSSTAFEENIRSGGKLFVSDDLQAQFVERHQQIIEFFGINRFVRKVGVHLRKRQKPLLTTHFD